MPSFGLEDPQELEDTLRFFLNLLDMPPFASSKPSLKNPKNQEVWLASETAWLMELASIQNALGQQVIVRCFVIIPDLDGKAISNFLCGSRDGCLTSRVCLKLLFSFRTVTTT